MPVRRLNLPYEAQPQGDLPALADDLSDALAFLFVGSLGDPSRNLANGSRAVATTSGALAPTSGGIAWKASSGKPIDFPDGFAPVLTSDGGDGLGDFTFLVVANPTSEATRRALISQDNTGGAVGQAYLIANCNTSYGASAGTMMFGTATGAVAGENLVSASGAIDGAVNVYVGVRRGLRNEIWRNGVLLAANTAAGTTDMRGTPASLGLCIGALHGFAGYESTHHTLVAAAWNKALDLAALQRVKSVGDLFLPQSIAGLVAAGGTTHNVTLTEAFTSTDTATSALTAAAAATETIAAAETLAAVMSAVASLTEAASTADAQTAARVQAAAATEAATATDAQAATLTAARSVTEAASATDLAAAVALAVAAVSEAISATESQSTSPVTTAALTEAASAADSASVIATLAAALSESASAADAITAAALLVRTLTESVNAADAATTAAQLVALLTESASLADVQSTGGGTAHNVSIDELALALDLVATVLVAPDVPLDSPLFARTAAAQARRIGRGSLDATDRRVGSPSITKPAAG